jgi:hypothetical protein
MLSSLVCVNPGYMQVFDIETGCASTLFDANPQSWDHSTAGAASNSWITILGLDVIPSGETSLWQAVKIARAGMCAAACGQQASYGIGNNVLVHCVFTARLERQVQGVLAHTRWLPAQQ